MSASLFLVQSLWGTQSRECFRYATIIVFTILACVFWVSVTSAGTLDQPASLQRQFETLAAGVDGRAGICAQSGQSVACVNGDEYFSLQSVMKVVVAAAVMEAVDRGALRLNDSVTVRKEDLSLYVQPLAKLVAAHGGQIDLTVGDLVQRAVTQSDSAATDILFARVGGPVAINHFLERRGIKDVRIDRNERELQTEIAGLVWRPEFTDEKVLQNAIKALPDSVRDRAFDAYLKDRRDTATPKGMMNFLHALASRTLLSPQSCEYLLDVMSRTVTFRDRIRAGVPSNWRVSNKTGTSGTWKGINGVTNDVGILFAPDGGTIALAVFLAESKHPSQQRAKLISEAARAAAAAYR